MEPGNHGPLPAPAGRMVDAIYEAMMSFEEQTGRCTDVVYVGVCEWTSLSTGLRDMQQLRIRSVPVKLVPHVYSMIGPAVADPP